MDPQEATPTNSRPRFSLSQETITIVTVGVALAGLILVSQGEMRAEARADRAEARADRAELRTELEAMRAEARADRRAFAEQITRLVEKQGTLSGLVDGLRHPIPSQGD